MPRVVKIIPATLQEFTSTPLDKHTKKRVAGYARVSTDSEEQSSSYDTQVKYYSNYIKSKEDWDFVKVYTDEGISGTSTLKREGFKTMIQDALNGKIDLIITKSVSRFARNTVDSLTTVRQLKEKGVEVYFEKENIWTLDSKGELLITIMSSLAQEESRSISENCTWGIRKRFEEGKVRMSFASFLGYEKDDDGNIVINEREARIVKYLYSRYLQGIAPNTIAKELELKEIKNVRGQVKWYGSTIQSMLKNEKYTGNAILQKTYSTDFLSKKRKVNNGEVPKYYVENSHPSIITQEQYDLVQEEFKKRGNLKNKNINKSVFANKVICGDCGSVYTTKTWHSTSKYKRIIFQCSNKYKNKVRCTTPHFYEEELKEISVNAINELIKDKDSIIESCNLVINQVLQTEELKAKEESLTIEVDKLSKELNQLVASNATTIQNQADYDEKYNNLYSTYSSALDGLKSLQSTIQDKTIRQSKIKQFLNGLKAQDEIITEFSSDVFLSLIDIIKVYSKDDIKVVFKNEYMV
jgi:DNA invertase Pin-like site-specific DNA recombinase/FtsZ-binding cell division protein ZapB